MANLNITNPANNDANYAKVTDLSVKAPLQSPAFTGTVTGVNAAMVGLSNVTNTTDTAKPVSTVQATAVAAAMFGVAPRIGYVASPPGFISSSAGTPTSGQLAWYPFTVEQGYTIDALTINIATAQVGGTTTFQAAVYSDDGTGWPDGTQQAVAPQIFTLTATGNIAVTLGTPVVLAPGRYWVFVLYRVTTAPTTAPSFQCLTNTTWSLPIPTTVTLGQTTRGYMLAGQTTFPSAAITTTGVQVVQTVTSPVIGFRRSA